LESLPVSRIVATEIMRASIGTNVCNYRRSVRTSTWLNDPPAPFSSTCKLPDDNLEDIYRDESIKFEFPIRPIGGTGFGLFSDAESLWRSDVKDSTHESRALAFLSQLFDYKDFYTTTSNADVSLPVIGVVTHGEMVRAVYSSIGEVPYEPRNTQVVPIMVDMI
jgi:hypothetical protein